MGKTKVAVLGGGVGSMAAAMQLTATPALRAEFDVTVYQQGWRLGGKGASGRNAERGQRIEEHGLHMWFGFYDNAFRLMREAYDELGRTPGDPLATLEDAFHPLEGIALYDRQGSEWWSLAGTMAKNAGHPGDGHGMPGFWDVNVIALEIFRGWWSRLLQDDPNLNGDELDLPPWLSAVGQTVGLGVDSVLTAALRLAREQAAGLPKPPLLASQTVEDAYTGLLGLLREAAWATLGPLQADDPQLRFFFTTLDVLVSAMSGIVADGVLDDPLGLECLDDLDLAEWLKKHGAKHVTLGKDPAHRSPLLRALYDLSFGYPDGDVAKANISAGTAIDDLLRLSIAYRGSLAYKMQAGMGDAVFAPFYEVLRARGVRFSFFSAVTELHLHPQLDRIEAIDVVDQVPVAAPNGYEPLVDVVGLPCWPSRPLWGQLQHGAVLKAQTPPPDFENELNPLKAPTRTLKLGADFDEVVLGISVGALPPITAQLHARIPRFAEAMDNAHLVATQAFQLWLNDDTPGLGYPHKKASVAGCFVEPMDTYADMSHLIGREQWTPADGVRSIAYFCGVLPHVPHETQDKATARVKGLVTDFLTQDVGGLWPLAVTKAPKPDMRWELLVDPSPAVGAIRLDEQYWRANIAGSELYVLSVAGSIKHRLPSGDTGVANMAAAGDWTRNGLNGGCVEAAAVSGIDAARSIILRHILSPAAIPPPPTNASPTWLKGA